MDTVRLDRTSLAARTVEEIRVAMTRRRMTGARLAAELGVSATWVSYRLNGQVTLDLNDLDRIAAVLEVSVAELIPGASDRPTRKYLGVPVQRPAPDVHPLDTMRQPAESRPTGGTVGYRVLTERPHDRRPPGRSPMSTPSPATRRPAPVRSHPGPMAR